MTSRQATYGGQLRRWLLRSIACGMALAYGMAVVGCEKAPAPVADPAKAPWLFEPQSQIDGLKNSDFRLRGISAFNLGNMGEKAAVALPELEKLAQNDPNPKVREKAREAADKIRAATGAGAD